MDKNHQERKNEEQIQANKEAWGKISKEHYENFKVQLADKDFKLNPMVEKELGDIRGKKILHLQCNTGADSILLARKGATVTGVDLVPDNVYYAGKLAEDFGMKDLQFIEADVLKLMEIHEEEYDIVLTTDGVIGWLPDLDQWGRVISYFLKEDGFFYLHDGHPFMMIFDEEALDRGELDPRYPYFQMTADYDPMIGGYASDAKEAGNYYWGHQFSTIINGLLKGNLYVTYLKEYDRCVVGMGGSKADEKGLWYYPELEGKLPVVFSLKAEKKR